MIGINAYARSYAGVPNVNNGLYQTYTGPGPGSLGKTEIIEYKDLMVNYAPDYQYFFDVWSRSAYMYNPAAGIWIMFDSVDSVVQRASYVSDLGLGGLLLWELSADAPSAETQTPLPGITALIDAIPFSLRALAPKAGLEQKSDAAPAVAFLGRAAFLACQRDDSGTLEVCLSTDDSATYGGTHVMSESSGATPALAAQNGQLILAWKGSGNDNLNTALVDIATDAQGKFTINGLTNKRTFADTSPCGPALAANQGYLFLAWTGSGDGKLNLALSTDNGEIFVGKFVSSETSDAAPSLASHKGRLFMAWKGRGNGALNVAEVAFSDAPPVDFAIAGLKNKVTLNETSDAAPALASDGRRLFLAWKGTGDGNLNVLFSPDDGGSFVGKLTSPEVGADGPALASDGSQIIIAWRSGNEQLNVAQVATC